MGQGAWHFLAAQKTDRQLVTHILWLFLPLSLSLVSLLKLKLQQQMKITNKRSNIFFFFFGGINLSFTCLGASIFDQANESVSGRDDVIEIQLVLFMGFLFRRFSCVFTRATLGVYLVWRLSVSLWVFFSISVPSSEISILLTVQFDFTITAFSLSRYFRYSQAYRTSRYSLSFDFVIIHFQRRTTILNWQFSTCLCAFRFSVRRHNFNSYLK